MKTDPPAPASPPEEPKPNNELWLETRDLLQRALTEWETQATTCDKPIDPPAPQAPKDPEKLQGLLQELKAKIDELSIP